MATCGPGIAVPALVLSESRRAPRPSRCALARWKGGGEEVVWLSTLTVTGSGLASLSHHERSERVVLFLDDPAAPVLAGEVVSAAPRDGLFLVNIRFVALSAEARTYLQRRTRGCASRLHDLATAGGCDVVEFCARFPHAFLVQTEHGMRPDVRSEVFFVCSRTEPLNPWRSVMVGRDGESDVRLRAQSVSRKHALFERDRASGGYLVKDLGAAAGTRIDGALVRDRLRPIASKSTLQIGRLSFVFLDPLDAHELLESTLRSRTRRAR